MIINAEGYNVEIGSIADSSLESILINKERYSSIYVLVDENTHEHCLPYLMYSVSGLEEAQIIEIPSGEENKILDICYQVWFTLTENNTDRKALLVNLGGGVIGDMGGFIASTYKRGIDFVNIPTTLLSQVDASVGGKVAIDFEGFKNQIGLFSNPLGVFIDANFLSTLDKRNVKSGLAEALKHGLILDKNHWQNLSSFSIDSEMLESLIYDSIRIKNEIVLEDPNERGNRKLLNFGHTIGHSIETYFLSNTNQPLLHGEAIAVGMIVEAHLSKSIGLSDAEFDEIFKVIQNHFDLPQLPGDSFFPLIELMKNDKKNTSDKINFTLLNTIGEASCDNFISEEDLQLALKFYNNSLS